MNDGNSISISDKNIILDEIDYRIIHNILAGNNNKQIASKLKIPLSTIQRRAKKLIQQKVIFNEPTLNYDILGFTSGLLHIYIIDGNYDQIGNKVSLLKGVLSTEIHIGNSDIVSLVVYKDNRELLNILSSVKRMEGVERIVWSERIYKINNNSDVHII
jgi:DNA-binding Lrp family transcriptional regulator